MPAPGSRKRKNGVIQFTTPIDVENGRWVILRVTDPAVPADERAPNDYAELGNAIAYTSPFSLDPDGD